MAGCMMPYLAYGSLALGQFSASQTTTSSSGAGEGFAQGVNGPITILDDYFYDGYSAWSPARVDFNQTPTFNGAQLFGVFWAGAFSSPWENVAWTESVLLIFGGTLPANFVSRLRISANGNQFDSQLVNPALIGVNNQSIYTVSGAVPGTVFYWGRNGEGNGPLCPTLFGSQSQPITIQID